MWFFRGCSPSRNDTTPRYKRLIFWTLHTTLESRVQWSCMKLDHWFYYNLPGETLVQNSKTHRTSSNSNKPPTYVKCTRMFTICNSNRIRQSSARKELTDSGGSEEKPRKRKEKPKSLQAACTRVPWQKTIAWYARENAACKSDLLGRWKTQLAHGDPTFVVHSVCCRVLRRRVFVYF
jgi:hypothetical protein